MDRCPVCGMDVDSARTLYKTIYRRRVYYFCSRICFDKFRSNPEYYILNGPEAGAHG